MKKTSFQTKLALINKVVKVNGSVIEGNIKNNYDYSIMVSYKTTKNERIGQRQCLYILDNLICEYSRVMSVVPEVRRLLL